MTNQSHHLSAVGTASVVEPVRRGFLGRCPACGQGRLFGRFLKVVPSCASCGAELHHHRADDFPPYIVMLLVGHIVGYGIYTTATRLDVPDGIQMIVWPTLAIVLSLALLQPVKGAVIALQFALGMHGFSKQRSWARAGSDGGAA